MVYCTGYQQPYVTRANPFIKMKTHALLMKGLCTLDTLVPASTPERETHYTTIFHQRSLYHDFAAFPLI